MVKKIGIFIICVAIPLAVGALSGFISSSDFASFTQLNKPPLAPPGYIFPIVWTILYILMGIASYLVATSDASYYDKKLALTFYGIQLVVNFWWSIFFFNFNQYLFAFVWLVLLWILILATLRLFYQSSKVAGWLMVPYLVWVTFAGYLNIAIYVLN